MEGKNVLRENSKIIFDVLRFCALLGKELSPSRLKDVKWCSCGSCVSLTPKRKYPCEPLIGLRTKVRESGQCIVQHPSFYKVALDCEVLRVLLVNLRVERKRKRHRVDNENRRTVSYLQPLLRCLRYCAYRAFVAWCYGHLGFRKRFELPACVRAAIMDAFPSEMVAYVPVSVRIATYFLY
ncbi:hypothetical protein COOONC_17926 [Cooperia oncophora]